MLQVVCATPGLRSRRKSFRATSAKRRRVAIVLLLRSLLLQSYNHTVIQSSSHTVNSNYLKSSHVKSCGHTVTQSYSHTGTLTSCLSTFTSCRSTLVIDTLPKHTYKLPVTSYLSAVMQSYSRTVLQRRPHRAAVIQYPRMETFLELTLSISHA